MATPKGVITVALILFVWSLSTYLVRCWVKRRAWAPDDSVVSVALLFILVHVILILKANEHGFPQPWSQLDAYDKVQACKMIYIAQIFYLLALGSIRLSSSVFNVRLTLDTGNKLIATCVVVACAMWTAASLLVVALRGDLSEPWLILDGSDMMYIRWLCIEIVGSTLDLGLWASSVYFIARLNMPISRKCYLALIFGVRLGMIPFTVLRLISLSPSQNPDQELPSTPAYIYTELVLNFAFIAAQCVCLKPFLRAFEMSNSHAVRPNELSGGVKNSRGDTYYMLSATRSTADNTHAGLVSRLSELDTQHSVSSTQPTFRPGHKSRTTIESQHCNTIQNEDPSKMTISMTKEYDVAIFESGVRLKTEEA